MRTQCVYCEAGTEYLNIIQMNSMSVVNLNLLFYSYITVGRDSSVGIATRYVLDGTGIESRWRRRFPYLSRLALGPIQPPISWVPGLFAVVTKARAWR